MHASPLPLDPAAVRAHFPAFSEPSLDGWAFFENAGGSYPCGEVVDRLADFYRRTKVQPYAPYPAAEAAGEAMEAAYRRLAAVFNVTADAIHFGPSTSANTYALARAFARHFRPGAAIIVTNQDHEANSGAFRRLATEAVEVREWRVDPVTGHLDIAGLERLLDDKVALVAFPHASNIVGEFNPAAEICALVAEAGAISVVDGVATAPHGPPDVAAVGADIYLVSTYKFYGPHLGLMTVRPSLAKALPNQGHYFNDADLGKRLTPAGPDHAQIAAAAGIAEYLEAIAALAGGTEPADPYRRAFAAIRAQEQALMAPLVAFLAGRPDVRLIGPAGTGNRAPTFSLATRQPAAELAASLADHKIMAAGGHFYAVRVLEALGIDPAHGVLRLSFLHYTTQDEIDRLIEALKRVLAGRP